MSQAYVKMVLDGEVLIAVTSGDVDAVKAWLAADPSRDVNDFCQEVSMDSGKPTMLHSVIAYVLGAGRTEARVAMIRWLLANGADPGVHREPVRARDAVSHGGCGAI